MLLGLTEGVQEQNRGSVSTYRGIEANENNFMMYNEVKAQVVSLSLSLMSQQSEKCEKGKVKKSCAHPCFFPPVLHNHKGEEVFEATESSSKE